MSRPRLPTHEDRGCGLVDELVRRQEENGSEGMRPHDVAIAVQLLGLKLRDVTPPSPPYDRRDFEFDEPGGATVRIIVTFKHGYLSSIAVYPS